MKRKFKAFVSILAVFAILSGCAETPAAKPEASPVEEVTEDYSSENLTFEERLSKLKWGMELDDVMKIIDTEPQKKEVETTSQNETQTLLTYENQVCEGYDSYLIICIVEGKGLNGINYHIPTDNPEELYAVLCKELEKRDCLYDPASEIFSLWHFDNDNYTIMLANFGPEVQLSYFPLFSEEERGQ